MKKQIQILKIDRKHLHSLLSTLTLIRLKSKKIKKVNKGHSELVEILPGMTIVEKRNSI